MFKFIIGSRYSHVNVASNYAYVYMYMYVLYMYVYYLLYLYSFNINMKTHIILSPFFLFPIVNGGQYFHTGRTHHPNGGDIRSNRIHFVKVQCMCVYRCYDIALKNKKKAPKLFIKSTQRHVQTIPPPYSHFIFFHHFHFQSLFDDFSHLIRFAIQEDACLAGIRNLFQEWLIIGVRWKLSNCHRVILWRMQLQYIMQTYQTINAIINYCK